MTATTAPTRAEIDELIAFIREELETRAACALPPEADGYRESASRALSIAERLPALVEERDDARAGRGMISDRSFETGLQMMDIAAERDRLAAEVERLSAGISAIVNCQSALPRAVVREACAEILNGKTTRMVDQSPFVASLSAARATIAELREVLESAGRQVADGHTILATTTIYDALAKLDATME